MHRDDNGYRGQWSEEEAFDPGVHLRGAATGKRLVIIYFPGDIYPSPLFDAWLAAAMEVIKGKHCA